MVASSENSLTCDWLVPVDDASHDKRRLVTLRGAYPRQAAIDSVPEVTEPLPTTEYTQSGEVTIAYQVTGVGHNDIVVFGDWSAHLDIDWENAWFASFLERLAHFCRVIRFDRRGQGLSDRRLPPREMEEEVADMAAVLDAAGSVRAALFGNDEAGARAALFAAMVPHRVSALILFAPFAKGCRAEDYPFSFPREVMQTFEDVIQQRWGRGWQTAAAAEIASDPDYQQWNVRSQRYAMGPGDAARMFRLLVETDIRAVLPSIQAPTLVLHRSDDQFSPIEQSRWFAAQIPNATLIELPGTAHFHYVDSAEVLGHIEEFLTGTRTVPRSHRSLATVLFTDIVGSTQTAADLGDDQWRLLLESHHRVTDGVILDFGGRRVNSTGDGVLATFDGPARAVRCAVALTRAIAALGLQIRAGVHTGEVERIGQDLAGIGVHVGARVAALAEAGEVLVTSTVKDLALGSGIGFRDHGSHLLKGIDAPWHVYAVEST